MSWKKQFLIFLRQTPRVDAEVDAQRAEQAHEHLLRHITSARADEAVETFNHRPVKRGRKMFAIGSLALVALLAGITTLTSRHARPDNALAHELDAASQAAKRQKQTKLNEDQYWYARSEDFSMVTVGDKPSYSYRQKTLFEKWVNRSGETYIRARPVGKPQLIGKRDYQHWLAAGRPKLDNDQSEKIERIEEEGRSQTIVAFGSGGLTYDELLALPADTETLRERVEEAAKTAGPSPSVEMFVIVGDLLRLSPISPQLAANLYQVTKNIDGVTLVGQQKDDLGRVGTVIAKQFPGDITSQMAFDPKTGQLLAEREIARKKLAYADVQPGTVISSSTYLAAGPVGEVGERVDTSGRK